MPTPSPTAPVSTTPAPTSYPIVPTALPTNAPSPVMWEVSGSVGTQDTVNVEVRRATLDEHSVQLAVTSAIALNPYAPDSLAQLRGNVTVRVTPSALAACTLIQGMEWVNVAFDFRFNSSEGQLPFPVAMLFSNGAGFAYTYYRKKRALYLCLDGSWQRTTDATFCSRTALANWGLDVLLNDRVPDPSTFLLSYTCHNTDFSVLQSQATSGCSAFVRECNDCIDQYYGCQCTKIGVVNGFSKDTAPLVLAFCAGAAGCVALVFLMLLRLRGKDGALFQYDETDAGAARLKQTLYGVLYVFFEVVGALLWVLALQFSPGDPFTPSASHAVFTGLAVIPVVVTALGAIMVATSGTRAWQALPMLARVAHAIMWLLPSAHAGLVVTPVIGALYAVAVAVTYAQLLPASRPLWGACGMIPSVLFCLVLGVLLLARVPCE